MNIDIINLIMEYSDDMIIRSYINPENLLKFEICDSVIKNHNDKNFLNMVMAFDKKNKLYSLKYTEHKNNKNIDTIICGSVDTEHGDYMSVNNIHSKDLKIYFEDSEIFMFKLNYSENLQIFRKHYKENFFPKYLNDKDEYNGNIMSCWLLEEEAYYLNDYKNKESLGEEKKYNKIKIYKEMERKNIKIEPKINSTKVYTILRKIQEILHRVPIKFK